MVLTYDAYSETLESEKQKEDKLTVMEERFNTMQSQIQALIMALGSIKDQKQIDHTVQLLYKSGIVNIDGSKPQ